MIDKEVTNVSIGNIDDAFKGIVITPNDTIPAMLRQMVWDGFNDEVVESVISTIGMVPSAPEVFKKELRDSHRRIEDLAPLQPLIVQIIKNMATAHTAASLMGGTTLNGEEITDINEVPEFIKQHIFNFNRNIIFSTVISTLSTLKHLGYLNFKAYNGQ